jgi:hypothetical protein
MVKLPDSDLRKIRRLARKVRRWADEYVARSYDYSDDLCGMCAICSTKLWHLLREHGYKARIVMAVGHVFVVYRGYLIDVTATQFLGNCGPVVLRPWKRDAEPYFWRPRKIYWSPEMVYQRQLDENWPDEQMITFIPGVYT